MHLNTQLKQHSICAPFFNPFINHPSIIVVSRDPVLTRLVIKQTQGHIVLGLSPEECLLVADGFCDFSEIRLLLDCGNTREIKPVLERLADLQLNSKVILLHPSSSLRAWAKPFLFLKMMTIHAFNQGLLCQKLFNTPTRG